ncbi:hypothetical protein H1R17_12750 [Flavobacterium sp. xlx-214]|uniref:hypothetical protein n=1 Tax=unclassified Flavobacterium TaxID=196869 RepID=UPI0013D75212|nr:MULTISPECIES: hypothetical protein [unclassified Flavobacterium]MBA5791540.1 hypothetical protein [Flavobacterium sp. xlx-221]QMI83310.1 hypothetical protein H1R17_12750 [Flavobacterium sp. xlx-214]
MAYITKAVYNKLTNSRGTQKVEVPPDLYNEIIYHFGVDRVLSSHEFNMLGEHIKILQGLTATSIETKYLHPKKDMLLYVFEHPGAYKYHLFENCKYLNNDFNNYKIPDEVSDRGIELVNEYRNWFIKNEFDKVEGSERVAKITFKYNTSFAPLHKLPRLSGDYKLIINIKNSTYEISKQFYSLMNVQDKIRKFVKDYRTNFNNRTIFNLMEFSYYENDPKYIIEQKVSELTSDVFIKNYGYEKLMNDFRKANQIKYLIMKELKLFINFRCGFVSNNFSKDVLESCGLVCCKACLDRFENPI